MISISYMETGGGIAGCQRLKLVPAVGESKLIVRDEREWTRTRTTTSAPARIRCLFCNCLRRP
jgi:hypothetical protein